MSEPPKQFERNFDPSLSNSVVGGTNDALGFRNAIPTSSTATSGPPALPPRPDFMQSNYGMMNSSYPMGGMGAMGGNYGMGFGGYNSYGSFGSGYGMGGMAMNPYGGFNRYGPMYGDIESRFIQMAEENSRPTFDSIQSVVHAVGSVAMMLENTFFALTSSFRAILGVAENFGRLRSLFAQFWSTFAVVRSLNWIVRKLLVLLGIRTENEFKAWAEAVAATQNGSATPEQRARGSSWPILLFFGVIAAAPYIVLRMLNGLTSNIHERLTDPSSWQNPLRAVAQYDYQATSPQEVSFNASQVLTLAPQHLQGQYWNSGWLMATTDRQHAGLVPVNYIKVIKPTNQIENNTTNDKSEGDTSKKDSEPVNLDKYYADEL